MWGGGGASRNDVLKSDILRRVLDDEDLCYDDFLMIHDEYGGNKENVKMLLLGLKLLWCKRR